MNDNAETQRKITVVTDDSEIPIVVPGSQFESFTTWLGRDIGPASFDLVGIHPTEDKLIRYIVLRGKIQFVEVGGVGYVRPDAEPAKKPAKKKTTRKK